MEAWFLLLPHLTEDGRNIRCCVGDRVRTFRWTEVVFLADEAGRPTGGITTAYVGKGREAILVNIALIQGEYVPVVRWEDSGETELLLEDHRRYLVAL